MTLEELQAEFPHSSRWRAAPHVRVVVGWQTVDGPTEGKVLFTTEGFNSDDVKSVRTYFVRRDMARIPDPVPCPITEPTTIRGIDDFDLGDVPMISWGNHHTHTYGRMAVAKLTLHPAEPGATEGRYTWKQPT